MDGHGRVTIEVVTELCVNPTDDVNDDDSRKSLQRHMTLIPKIMNIS